MVKVQMPKAKERKGKEGVFKMIGKSFPTYFKNLNFSLPFLFLIALILILVLVFTFTLGPSLERVQDFQFSGTDLALIVTVALFFLVILMTVSSFITSGIIGMASEIVNRGKSNLSTFFKSGGKFWLRFLGATLTVLVLVGVPFLILLLIADNFVQNSSIVVQTVVVIIMVLLLLAFFVLFTLAPYLLVMRDLRVFASIKESYGIAKRNYLDLILLTLIFMVASIGINLIPYVGVIVNMLIMAPIQTLVLILFINSRK